MRLASGSHSVLFHLLLIALFCPASAFLPARHRGRRSESWSVFLQRLAAAVAPELGHAAAAACCTCVCSQSTQQLAQLHDAVNHNIFPTLNTHPDKSSKEISFTTAAEKLSERRGYCKAGRTKVAALGGAVFVSLMASTSHALAMSRRAFKHIFHCNYVTKTCGHNPHISSSM